MHWLQYTTFVEMSLVYCCLFYLTHTSSLLLFDLILDFRKYFFQKSSYLMLYRMILWCFLLGFCRFNLKFIEERHTCTCFNSENKKKKENQILKNKQIRRRLVILLLLLLTFYRWLYYYQLWEMLCSLANVIQVNYLIFFSPLCVSMCIRSNSKCSHTVNKNRLLERKKKIENTICRHWCCRRW